jgi:MarR family transcriptional regulator, temperature-dependent positive regulator of motility
VTVLRAPEHLARRFQQICETMLVDLFAAQGLASWQYGLVVQLRTTPGLGCTRLAAAIGRDATSTGQALDMLVARGLVARSTAPEDRRAWSFALTPAGLAFHEAMRPQVTTASRRITSPLSPAEAETLLDLLTRLVVTHEAHARPGTGRRPPRRRIDTAEAAGVSPWQNPPSSPPAAARSASGSSAPSSAGRPARRSRSPPRPA